MTLRLRVLSTNACFQEDWQESVIAEFISIQQADIVFVQESLGGLADIAHYLRKHKGYDACVFCERSATILRRGCYLQASDTWPASSYYVDACIDKCTIRLVNVHLCEMSWQTADQALEKAYRGNFINRILDALYQTQLPTIIAGDFNNTSHLDKTEEDICTKASISSCSLEAAGFVDAYLNERQLTSTSWTWPSEVTAPFLRSQSAASDQKVRIDRIYVRGWKCVRNAYHSQMDPIRWYSDHLAVQTDLSHPKEEIPCTKPARKSGALIQARNPSENESWIAICVSYSNKWTLSANGLNGERESYIQLEEDNGRNLGWFYVDGLESCRNVELTNESLYQYHTIDFSRPLPMRMSIAGKLFNAADTLLMSFKVLRAP